MMHWRITVALLSCVGAVQAQPQTLVEVLQAARMADKNLNCTSSARTNAQGIVFDWSTASWGDTLVDEAQDADNPRAARALWKLAANCYAQALKLDPKNSAAATGLGNALSLEANTLAKTDMFTARALWVKAKSAYALALAINPRHYVAASGWATAVLQERGALIYAGPEQVGKLRVVNAQLQNLKILLLSHVDDPEATSAYNLACIFAVQGNAAEAIKSLQRSDKAGRLSTKKDISIDLDFDGIRQDATFKAWFDKLEK